MTESHNCCITAQDHPTVDNYTISRRHQYYRLTQAINRFIVIITLL